MSEKLIDTFLNEANELVIDIERSLLDLGDNSDRKESISAIFRAMHTLKGAAGMFGYERVNSITHHLENIYQAIRDGKRTLDQEVIQITLQTVDMLRVLLNASSQDTDVEGFQEILVAIQEIDGLSAASEVGSLEASHGENTFYIKFIPKSDILRNGTNPLYLVDDLLALGQGFALPSFPQLPMLDDLDLESCYIAFELVIATEKSPEDIESVFLFVEGDCELEICKISSGNSVKDFSCDNHPFVTRDTGVLVGFDIVKNVVDKANARRVADRVNKTVKAKSTNIRVNSERLDELMNLVSELVTTQARLSLFATDSQSAELSSIAENIEKITRRLRDNTFTMTLIPLDTMAVRFQRLVNDLSNELGKQIEFLTIGLDTKIDKSMAEKLTDPILHVLRNCIDHGIESVDSRLRKGKNPKGTITLKSYYSGSSVVIEIADDGAGIKLEKVREKAVAQGLITASEELSDKELTELIFLPGFSTATSVTGVSGRGVGMDVVRRNLNDIQGEIEVISLEGKGTSFIIKLPLTLSILDGLLVKIGGTDFILPLSVVAKCYEVPTDQLESTFNQWITLDGTRVPFIYLREAFNLHDHRPYYSQIISVPFDGNNVGIAVDRIVGECQAVLKPLGQLYKHQDEFSGATILGDGTVALVLDTQKVIKKIATSNNVQQNKVII